MGSDLAWLKERNFRWIDFGPKYRELDAQAKYQELLKSKARQGIDPSGFRVSN
jgi:hypothetical protein